MELSLLNRSVLRSTARHSTSFIVIALLLAIWAPVALGQRLACDPLSTRYEVSLRDRAQHILHVRIALRANPRGNTELQLPVWNALYQVRDFAQYIRTVSAQDENGKPLPVRALDKTTWRVGIAGGCAVVSYEIFVNEAGPFSAQVNDEHAFLNWAQVLMYPPDARGDSVHVSVVDLPQTWKVRDAYVFAGADQPGAVAVEGEASDYDSLVDSPVEMGTFAESTFEAGGAKYRVVVHGVPADYDMQKVTDTLKKIVAAETDWMQDRPFTQYTFLYHFPHGPAGGGMEHAYSTAIDVSGQRMAQNPLAFAGVTAHEFFHLWNVKRIRPQSLEPVDYTKEMYTRALWFSEGVTSTVQESMLVRAGLIDEDAFLQHLSEQISVLQERPAHATQSVEESSLDTWFDKYAYYRDPERSINYYNKGQILGALLDLRMREVSHGTKSLRDLFQYMNANYAKKDRYFSDSDGVRDAVEKVTGSDFHEFFARYVAGVEEIPYDEFLQSVGLQLSHRTAKVPYAGFRIGRSFGQSSVASVDPDSEARKAGLKTGDIVIAVNGKKVSDVAGAIALLKPGENAVLTVRGHGSERQVKVQVETQERDDYVLEDLAEVSPQQRARRAAWMRGDSEAPQHAAATSSSSTMEAAH